MKFKIVDKQEYIEVKHGVFSKMNIKDVIKLYRDLGFLPSIWPEEIKRMKNDIRKQRILANGTIHPLAY